MLSITVVGPADLPERDRQLIVAVLETMYVAMISPLEHMAAVTQFKVTEKMRQKALENLKVFAGQKFPDIDLKIERGPAGVAAQG